MLVEYPLFFLEDELRESKDNNIIFDDFLNKLYNWK